MANEIYLFSFNIDSIPPPPSTTIIETSPTLKFTLDYPLTTPFHFCETHADGKGWTEIEFCDAVRRAYREVYANPNLYGIWGHSIDQLWLERAWKVDNEWQLAVGS